MYLLANIIGFTCKHRRSFLELFENINAVILGLIANILELRFLAIFRDHRKVRLIPVDERLNPGVDFFASTLHFRHHWRVALVLSAVRK